MLSNPKCIVISTDLFFFCSVVARGTSHFYSFFRKKFWQELIFGMTTMAFGLGKPNPGQKLVHSYLNEYMKVTDYKRLRSYT